MSLANLVVCYKCMYDCLIVLLLTMSSHSQISVINLVNTIFSLLIEIMDTITKNKIQFRINHNNPLNVVCDTGHFVPI